LQQSIHRQQLTAQKDPISTLEETELWSEPLQELWSGELKTPPTLLTGGL